MKKFMRENLKFICFALIILAGSFIAGTNTKKAGAATRKCYTINKIGRASCRERV